MNRLRALLLFAALAVAFVLARGVRHDVPPPAEPALAIGRVLGEPAPDPGFARTLAPREFSFPADHGPHPAFMMIAPASDKVMSVPSRIASR